ncbi:MAG: hypothetical protein QW636_07430, partial [Candidatus Bathyarchaeia archaeon]
MEHIKAGLMRLKRAEDEKALREKLANLERERNNLSNLWLSKKLGIKYTAEAQEKDVRQLKELEQRIKEIERLQAEIPRLQVQMAEIYK